MVNKLYIPSPQKCNKSNRPAISEHAVSEDEIEGVREKIGYRNSLYVSLYKSCSFRCSGEYVCEEDYVASPIGKQTLFYIF